MNLLEAERIMELSGKYDTEYLKKQYKKLAMIYHPDKCKDPKLQNKMIEINSAYSFLLKYKENGITQSDIDEEIINAFNEMFKSFINSVPPNIPVFVRVNKVNKVNYNSTNYNNNKIYDVELNIKEYLKGCSKTIEINHKDQCNCDFLLCIYCAGSGYEIPSMNLCMNCTGVGFYKKCDKCENGLIIKEFKHTLKILPGINLDETFTYDLTIIDSLKFISVKYHLKSDEYYYKDNMLIYKMNITLKQALSGLNTTYVDPFKKEHNIVVDHLIRKGDAYCIKVVNTKIYILFNIIYPKKISERAKKQLSHINF